MHITMHYIFQRSIGVMGFLDKLVKKGVDSLIENVANTVTDAVNNAM